MSRCLITFAVSLVFMKNSIKDSSIPPLVHTASMSLIKLIFSLVGISIAKAGLAMTVPTSMTPIASVDSAVLCKWSR